MGTGTSLQTCRTCLKMSLIGAQRVFSCFVLPLSIQIEWGGEGRELAKTSPKEKLLY